MTLDSIKEFGQKKANPQARRTNNLKLANQTECPELVTCEDTLTGNVAADRRIASVTYNGQVFSTTADVVSPGGEVFMRAPGLIDPADSETLDAWLNAVVEVYEFNRFVKATYEGVVFTLVHRGQCEITAVTLDNATVINATRCCTIAAATKWLVNIVGDPGDFAHDGNTQALANAPYAYSGTLATDQATAATLKTDVEAALTAVAFAFEKVEVNVNTVLEAYEVLIYSTTTTALTVGGEAPTNCGLVEFFSC